MPDSPATLRFRNFVEEEVRKTVCTCEEVLCHRCNMIVALAQHDPVKAMEQSRGCRCQLLKWKRSMKSRPICAYCQAAVCLVMAALELFGESGS